MSDDLHPILSVRTKIQYWGVQMYHFCYDKRLPRY